MPKQSRSQIAKRYARSLKGRYNALKNKAREHHHKVTLSFDDFCQIAELPCHYCNKTRDPESVSYWVDRIDNSKGYERQNVLPCCGDCNRIRNDKLTVEEMYVVIGALLGFRRTRAS